MDVVEFSEVEAGANFAEVLRLVRAGRRVVVVCDGEAVAEVGLPRGQRAEGEGWHEYLARTGQLQPAIDPKAEFPEGVRVEGALERFLKERG